MFHLAEHLLRTALQNSRLSLAKTQAGWTLLGAVMTLGQFHQTATLLMFSHSHLFTCKGSSVMKHHLPRLLLLWRNAFPRSAKELEEEKAQGDAFSWHVTLEGRAGALNGNSSNAFDMPLFQFEMCLVALRCFVTCCKDLVSDDVTRRLLAPAQNALDMLPRYVVSQLCKQQRIR